MSVSFWLDDSKSKKVTADVVVIGGGIAGLSTAYWLSREDSNLKVALVEKGRLAIGATGRNAGFITCGSVEHFNRLVSTHGRERAHQIWRFSEINLELLKEHILAGSDKDVMFEQKGSFSLASTDTEFTELKKSADLMASMKINVEVLDGSAIESRLKAVGFVGGIKYVDDASVHPVRMINLIRKKLEAAGSNIEIFEHNEVQAIEARGDSRVVRTDRCEIECSMVVMATNGYSALVHPYFKEKIFPTRGQILATEPVPKFMEGPCYANFVLDYFRQLPTGEMLIGGFRQLQRDAEKGYSDETTEVIQSALEKFLQDHIPPVRGARITHRWSGIMGFSVDGQPMVGALPSDPMVYFVGGFTGHGIGLAFHAGKAVVDTMFDRAIPDFISARRFG